jgi:predicted enzyme related to lactoylglutathione lyase
MAGDAAPEGLACWADLWTSDTEAARRFYGELLGWESGDPDPEFGGYFLFTLDGVEVVGAMGDMGEMKAANAWKPYLATDDAEATMAKVVASGGSIFAPPMPVGDRGTQFVFADPTGAGLGAWQSDQFPGFTRFGAHGLPVWFELHTSDYGAALAFYAAVFGWEASSMSDTDDFRYSTVSDPRTSNPSLGILEASGRTSDGFGSHWLLYFDVDDIDASTALVPGLGGRVLEEPNDTPFGRMSLVEDTTGARFRLTSPLA